MPPSDQHVSIWLTPFTPCQQNKVFGLPPNPLNALMSYLTDPLLYINFYFAMFFHHLPPSLHHLYIAFQMSAKKLSYRKLIRKVDNFECKNYLLLSSESFQHDTQYYSVIRQVHFQYLLQLIYPVTKTTSGLICGKSITC